MIKKKKLVGLGLGLGLGEIHRIKELNNM